MKFEDIKEGMYVRDHLGNEYCVVKLAPDARYGYKVCLKCTKHVKSVRADFMSTFKAVNDTWWIQCDRSKLLNADDPAVQQMLQTMCYSSPYNTPVAVTVTIEADVSCTFYMWSEYKYKAFELTATSLCPIAVPEAHVVASTDSLELGMKLQRADGTYIVIGFDDQYVYMGAVVDATTCDGVTHKAAMCTQIPVEAPEGQLSLKDFTVAED